MGQSYYFFNQRFEIGLETTALSKFAALKSSQYIEHGIVFKRPILLFRISRINAFQNKATKSHNLFNDYFYNC
jgi:hypothetical protein